MQTSKMESFATAVNIVAKLSILDICGGSGSVPDNRHENELIKSFQLEDTLTAYKREEII